MRTHLILIILLTVIVQGIYAYPISPRSLRQLVMESEFIVYADVIEIERLEIEDHWSDSKAILVIREILQGEINMDTIEVLFAPSMICPSPAKYVKGTTVLAFLDKGKWGFSTHALSYGSKSIDPIGYNIYKTRIIEMQNILEIEDQDEIFEETINWLINCSIDTITRWEGIYELHPNSDFISFYDEKKGTLVRKYELKEVQKLKLRRALFNTENLTFVDLRLIDLVVKKEDNEIVDFLIKALKKSKSESMWFSNNLISKIAELSNRDDLNIIAKKLNELEYSTVDRDTKAEQLTKEFLNKI